MARTPRLRAGAQSVRSIVNARLLRLDLVGRTLPRLALMLLVVSAALSPCVASATPEATPTVYDTGYEVIPLITTRSLYWLDNERLLFFGMKAGRGPRPDVRKLYIWDSKTKTTQFYADALAVCFSNGFISYRLHLDRDARIETVREGAFGSEKEIVRPLAPKGALHSNLTCRAHVRSDLVPTPPSQHVVAILREGDGYLDLGPHLGAALEERNSPMRNVVLYRQTGQAIQLPMTWEEGFGSGVAYSVHRAAYVLVPRAPRGAPVGIFGPWPKGRALTVYLVRPDGQTEPFSIPYWPSEYLGVPQPMKLGWIYGGGNFYKSAGLYFFGGDAVSKVDAGLVKEIAVTAHGCRVAVGIQNEHLKMGTPTNLRIFEFC